ncbi:MAG: TRAP transporter small permease [Aquamicrobium sp.]|uniref:TRAP transporter small permease n=1 Tax=Aquamicrobium sp. TaxID=1872579 RepID=UPI00349ECFCB|nr:TRAP transporter small permease [Aquamicrobium sp.]
MSQSVRHHGGTLHALLDRSLCWLENVAAAFAGAIMLLAMVLVSLDALLRYIFGAPLTFQYYLTEKYLMVGMVALSLSWGFRTGGYIRIEGLVQALPRRPRTVILRVGLLLSAGYIAVLAWLGGAYFLSAVRKDEIVMGVIDWPVSWSWIWIPVGCGLLALRLLLIAIGPDGGLVAKTVHAE